MKWQPIETAPKDGAAVLVFTDDGQITSARFDGSFGMQTWQICVPSQGYRDSDDVYPTHWMPLPLPPKDAK